MKKGAPRKSSGKKSPKTRSLPLLSPSELRRSAGERFSVPELPSARQDSPLARLVPVQYNRISKGLSNGFQWARRAAGIPQSEDEKTESRIAECGTDGNNPATRENYSHNALCKSVPGFAHNCVSCRIAALFKKARADGGIGPCWDECVSCEDGVDLHGKDSTCFDMKVFVPTTPLKLLRRIEKWRRDLEQLDLEAPFLSGKNNWAAIRVVHGMLKPILTILEARDNEVSNKYELHRASAELNGDDVYDPEESNDKDLYEALYRSFEEVSSVASERCVQALNLTTNCISESQDIASVSSVGLLPTAIDLVELYGRIKRVQENLALNEEKTIDSMKRNSEQEEERAFDCACRLIEAVSGYVNSIQNHVLHLDLMQQDGAGTSREENSVVICLQQSWILLNRLGKQVAFLCPNMKQKLFVYLLKTFIDAVGELSQHQKLLFVVYDENCEGHVATACFCQKILLHSLMKLFKNVEKAHLEFRKDGLVAAFNFVQSVEASRIYPVTLTLLLSLIAEQGGNTILESQYFSEIVQSNREELMSFAIPCMAVIQLPIESRNNALVHENSLDRLLPDMPSTGRFDRVNINAMTEIKELGAGSSGAVIKVMFDNTYVALKKSIFTDPIKARERLEREAKVHQRISSHPNILRFLGKAVQLDEAGKDQTMGIITEFCEFGDLSEVIKQAAWIQDLDHDEQDISKMKDDVGYQLYKDWIKRLEVVAGIAAGMVHMHKHYIVHRDLTSANVLLDNLDKTGRIGVKVCDFERGYYIKDGEPIRRTRAPANSIPWMGPEVLKHEKYDLKADVYSIGTVLWELMYLENPWAHLKERLGPREDNIQCLLTSGKVCLSISEIDVPEEVPEFPDLVRLVKYARERDPGNRPSMIEFYTKIRDVYARMKERLSGEEATC